MAAQEKEGKLIQEPGGLAASAEMFAFGDASDAYANHKQLYLSFYHLAADREISFKGFVTNLNNSFAADWGTEKVFGRGDPIMTFKSTTRQLNAGFEIPAASLEEAKLNLAKCNKLAQFMYPAYEKGNRANTIAKPPLMRVSFANLIKNPVNGASPSAKEAGLLVAISSLNIKPSFNDDGFFDAGLAMLYPKLITIDVAFTVLHERDLGWDATGNTENNAFGFSSPDASPFPFGLEGFQRPQPEASASEGDPVGDDDRAGFGATEADEEADALAGLPSAQTTLRSEREQLQTLRNAENPVPGAIRAQRQSVRTARQGVRTSRRNLRRQSGGY